MLLQALDAEHALAGIGEIPAIQHGEAIESLFQDVAQLPLVLCVELLIFRALAAPFLRLHLGAGQNQQVAVLEGVRRTGAGQQETDGIAALLQVILEPTAKTLIETVRLFRQHQNRQAIVPAFGLLGLIERRPRVHQPGFRQRDHAEGLRHLFGATDDVANLFSQLCQVRTVREELVVARARHQFGLRILFLAEYQTRTILVDVEAVLDDGREFYLESIVINCVVACDVGLQRGRLGAGKVANRDRA